MKRQCFDPFIHWLIKQIHVTNTCQNHLVRLYDNRSIHFFPFLFYILCLCYSYFMLDMSPALE